MGDLGTRLGLLGAMVFLVGGAIAFNTWDDFDTKAHSVSAIAMFAFLAAAAAGNAWHVRSTRTTAPYFWLYGTIAALMVLSAALLFPSDWSHKVLLLEAAEITLFGAFWLVQTREHWYETV